MNKYFFFILLCFNLSIKAQSTQAQIDSIMTLYPNCMDYPNDVLFVLDSLLVALAEEENTDNTEINNSDIDSLFLDFLMTNHPNVIQDGVILPNGASLINTLDLNSLGLHSLNGIEHFTNLEVLFCKNNQLVSVPTLPPSLLEIDLRSNSIQSIAPLPDNLIKIDIRYNELDAIPPFPNNIQDLKICFNNLNVLPNLPDSLKVFYCAYNNFESLPILPQFLEQILCYNNQLHSLGTIPESLEVLRAQNNLIEVVPELPMSLHTLDLSGNPIVCVNEYPPQFIEELSEYSTCISGCTDSMANNFSSEANQLDNSCTYTSEIIFPNDYLQINTGVNATYLIEQLWMNDSILLSGFTLGAFYYNEQGSLSCGGLRQWTGGPSSVAVFLDDETTPEKDGFSTGDEIVWLAYAADSSNSLNVAHIVNVQYISGSNSYTANSINLISSMHISNQLANLGCVDILAVNYNFTATINDFSCIYPHDIEIEELNNLVNTLSFQIDSLQQNGTGISEALLDSLNISVNLELGWNIIGYGCPVEKNVIDLFSDYEDTLLLLKDNFGAVYLPEFNFNGIGNLIPGMGYQIKTSEAISNLRLCNSYFISFE